MAECSLISQPIGRTATPISVGASASSVTLLAANPARLTMYVYNDSSSAMYLAFSTTASTSAYNIKVPANTLYEMPYGSVYIGVISAIWDSATGQARVTEVA